MFDAATYARRRGALLQSLRDRGVRGGRVLILGNRESPMNYRDNAYPFRQDSTFLYFAGIPEPDLALALDLDSGGSVLFADEISLDDEIWTGHRPSARELAAAVGIDKTRPRSELAVSAEGSTPILFLPPYRAEHREELGEILGIPPARTGGRASVELIRAVVALREIKEPAEIAEMDRAADLSAAMHRAAMARARPGLRESDLAARVEEAALAGGGGTAFPTIATTRGAVLHNHVHTRVLRDGDLFLLDAGGQTLEGYAGDLTSTFPVNGKYDPHQREIYGIVLAAHRAAASAMAPGIPYRDAHFAAARALAEGLRALGLMRGDAEAAVEAGAHALFFPHGVGHQVGLDVHDMESLGEDWVGYEGRPRSSQFGLSSLRMAKPLKPGMAVTVEPGLYFIRPLAEKWRAEGLHREFIVWDRLDSYMEFGGIRNEEDWIVTEDGARKLGGPFDKSPEALESAIGTE